MPFRIFIVVCALLPRSGFAAEADWVEGEVLVVFKPGFRTEEARNALGRHTLKLDRHFEKISRQSGRVTGLVRSKGQGTAGLIGRLKGADGVESVEPNFLRRFSVTLPNDTDFSKLWGLRNTGQTVNGAVSTSGVDAQFVPAWKLARPVAADVVVGVLDSGIDLQHPDLAANVWTNPGEIPGNGIDDDGNGYADDVHGYNFTGDNADLTDGGNHGTHVTGTIAAVGKNNAGIIGVHHRAKILPLKVSGDGQTTDVAAAIEAYDYAIDLKNQGVNIVALNASFGGFSATTAERLGVEALRDNGIILCAAAGNYSTNNNSYPIYPASYTTSNIIAVAALTQTNGLATFSNYGSVAVDLAAPGVNIYSTLPRDFVLSQSSVSVGATSHASRELRYSGTTTPAGISGTVHHCGIGNPGDFPPAVAGNIALIQRGTLTFAAKITNAMNAGATAAIVYDNTPDPLGNGWKLNGGVWIPAIQVTQASGLAILAALPATGTVANTRNDAVAYQFLDGTSMAAPHVTGAVAFAALNFPSETMSQRIARITGNVTPVPALAGKTVTGGRLNLLKMIDTEDDGLPDWWEKDFFGNLASGPTGDADADGFTNLDEFLAATHPANAASQLSFSAVAAREDGLQTHFVLSFPSVEDRVYQIDRSGTLESGSWQPLGPPVTGTGSLMEVEDVDAIHSAEQRFYRMRLVPE